MEIKKIHKTQEEWSDLLSPEQFAVLRKKGTEPAFSCAWKKHGNGTYHCGACDLPLFETKSKFESDSGWPSWFSPIEENRIQRRSDDSFGMHRTEVVCARCDSHLGHVFSDGPPPTNERFCINSIALNFKPSK